MCQQCGNNTRLTGFKELDGLCIRCWKDEADKALEVYEVAEEIRRWYGNKLYAAPDVFLRLFEALDRARGDLSA
jgi:SRSO17 transposase